MRGEILDLGKEFKRMTYRRSKNSGPLNIHETKLPRSELSPWTYRRRNFRGQNFSWWNFPKPLITLFIEIKHFFFTSHDNFSVLPHWGKPCSEFFTIIYFRHSLRFVPCVLDHTWVLSWCSILDFLTILCVQEAKIFKSFTRFQLILSPKRY